MTWVCCGIQTLTFTIQASAVDTSVLTAKEDEMREVDLLGLMIWSGEMPCPLAVRAKTHLSNSR